MIPPQPPPTWDHSPEDVISLTKEVINKDRTLQDEIGALAPTDCTFESVFLRLAGSEAQVGSVKQPLTFYKSVAVSKELCDAANDAESLFSDHGVESSMRLDVFHAKVAARKNLKASGRWRILSAEEQRLVETMILDGTRAGLALPEDARVDLARWKIELSQVCEEFMKHFDEEDGKIAFTTRELKGVPKSVISRYTKRTGGSADVYYVTYKTPDISPILKFATSPETRRRAHEGYESRLEINVPLLNKALYLRQRIATILGYKTWADYVTEVKMVKSPENAEDFLDELERKLQPGAIKERTILLMMKQAEHKRLGLPFDGEFYAWDHYYYDRKYAQQTLDLDLLVAEYFPVAVVIASILKVYQDLLGVRFEEITSGSKWHPEVQHFAVWEADASDASGFLGYCYLDLYPRAGKFPYAGMWSLKSGYHLPGGEYSYPATVMVANVAKTTANKPALMRHESVVSFFHEIGHAFHGLLSRTRFSRFHGTNVAQEFVETPSQMLENWCWEPEVLKKLSRHHKTQQPLPPDLIDKIVKSRFVNNGLYYLRRVFFSKFDLKVHTGRLGDSADYTSLWNSLTESVSLLKNGKHCPGQGGFGHIMRGHDVGYYGHTYSLVFAMDMYATVFKANPLDPSRGKRYRDMILGPGGSRDALDLLEDFLGRPPNNEAFLEALFGVAPT